MKTAKTLTNIFETSEAVSEQAINLSKSSINFGRKVAPEVRTRMRNLLDIHNEGRIEKYLGLPEQFFLRKIETFAYIIDKVKKLAHSWKQMVFLLVVKKFY